MATAWQRKAERARVAAVRAQLLPGHEALIEQLAADGVTSGPAAAVLVVRAELRRRAIAAQIEQELAGAAERFAVTVRAEDLARHAQQFVDRQFVVGVVVAVDDVIDLLTSATSNSRTK